MGPASGTSVRSSNRRAGRFPMQHGYDVRTGKELWTFHTFPHPGETGNEPGREDLQGNDSWKNRTGNNVWAFALTVDEEHGILYINRSAGRARTSTAETGPARICLATRWWRWTSRPER